MSDFQQIVRLKIGKRFRGAGISDANPIDMEFYPPVWRMCKRQCVECQCELLQCGASEYAGKRNDSSVDARRKRCASDPIDNEKIRRCGRQTVPRVRACGAQCEASIVMTLVCRQCGATTRRMFATTTSLLIVDCDGDESADEKAGSNESEGQAKSVMTFQPATYTWKYGTNHGQTTIHRSTGNWTIYRNYRRLITSAILGTKIEGVCWRKIFRADVAPSPGTDLVFICHVFRA